MKSFDLRIFDLYTGGQNDLKSDIRDFVYTLGAPELENPFYNIVRELVTNGLKAIYKGIFYQEVLQNSSREELVPWDWSRRFQTELENHSIYFGEKARQWDRSVDVHLGSTASSIVIDVVNPGLPSTEEKERIARAIQKSFASEGFAYLLDMEEDEDSPQGAAIGLPLVIMTLRGLGLTIKNFDILYKKNYTQAHVEILTQQIYPDGKEMTPVTTLNEKDQMVRAFYAVGRSLDHFVLLFDKQGDLRGVSRNFVDKMQLPDSSNEAIQKLLPQKFFDEVFDGPYAISETESVENYRIRLHLNGEDIFYNVNGILNQEGEVVTVWQRVIAGREQELGEGPVGENLHIQSIARRYIPATVLQKAREAAQAGQTQLAHEVKTGTAFFVDMVDFSYLSEAMETPYALDLLNTSFHVVAKIITKEGGSIDKFMGEAVFSLFDEPLQAVVAGARIQDAFGRLNAYREMNGEPPVFLRIGIHTGQFIMANVGPREHMEWTAVGEVIHTAYRIQENAIQNSVLMSEHTYHAVVDRVRVHNSFVLEGRGGRPPLPVHYLQGVWVVENGDENFIEL